MLMVVGRKRYIFYNSRSEEASKRRLFLYESRVVRAARNVLFTLIGL